MIQNGRNIAVYASPKSKDSRKIFQNKTDEWKNLKKEEILEKGINFPKWFFFQPFGASQVTTAVRESVRTTYSCVTSSQLMGRIHLLYVSAWSMRDHFSSFLSRSPWKFEKFCFWWFLLLKICHYSINTLYTARKLRMALPPLPSPLHLRVHSEISPRSSSLAISS